MAVEKPNAIQVERELLTACMKGSGTNFTTEDVTKLVTSSLTPDHFAHPHHKKMFVALTQAVRDSGQAKVEWMDVRGYIDEDSHARVTLRDIITDGEIGAVSEKWVERQIKKVDDTLKCRAMLNMMDAVKPKAEAGMAEDAYDGFMEAVFALSRERFKTGARPLSEYIDGIKEEVTARRNNEGVVGLKTGLEPIDVGFGGLQKKHLYLIGGRPGSMKSVVAAQVAYQVAKEGKRALLASPEMSAEQYSTRLACAIANLDYKKYNRGLYDSREEGQIHEALEALRMDNIVINEDGWQGTASLRQDCILFKPDILIVDYAQLFYPSNPKDNEYQDVTKFVRELNQFKKDFKIPILACVQLSRKVEEREDKRPIKSDLRMTGQFENDADGIMMLYREREYAKKDESGVWRIDDREINPNTLEWVNAKNRSSVREDFMTYTQEGRLWLHNEPKDGILL